MPARTKLPPLRALFSESWGLYRQRFTTLVAIIVVPTAVGFAGLLLMPVLVPLALAVFILAIAFYLAMVVALAHALDNPAANPLTAYRFAFRRLHSYLWLTILGNFITVGALLLAVIPGILVSVWFIFSLFTFAFEGRRGMDAFLASREYVRDYWWAVFGRFLLGALLLGVISGIISGVASAFGQSSDPTLTETIIQAVFGVLATPLFAAYLYRLFNHVRAVKGVLPAGPVSAKRGFFIFCGIFGLVAPILIVLLAGTVLLAGIVGFLLSQQPEAALPVGEQSEVAGEAGNVLLDTTGWNVYELETVTFAIPPDWTAENIYYQTPAAQEAGDEPQIVGVRLFPGDAVSGNDFIDIGGRQVDCVTVTHTRCSLIPALDTFTFTDSTDPSVVQVFDTFVTTIEKPK